VNPNGAITDQQPAGVFRKDLQTFASDLFDDCAHFARSSTVPFTGTAAQGKCLDSLLAPIELCNPANLDNYCVDRECHAKPALLLDGFGYHDYQQRCGRSRR
jgi:hypothetical protein